MSATPAPTADTNSANAVMLNQVTVPSFFRKMAADCGYTPRAQADAHQTLRLADMVKQAVDRFIHVRETAAEDGVDQAVKVAADVAYELAGVPTQPAAPPTTDDEFMADEAIKAAASVLVNDRVAGLDLKTPGAEPAPAPPAAPAP